MKRNFDINEIWTSEFEKACSIVDNDIKHRSRVICNFGMYMIIIGIAMSVFTNLLIIYYSGNFGFLINIFNIATISIACLVISCIALFSYCFLMVQNIYVTYSGYHIPLFVASNLVSLKSIDKKFKLNIQDREKLDPSVIKIIDNAESRGGFYIYEAQLLKEISFINEHIEKNTVKL